MTASSELDRLLAIMVTLRDPTTGCAWDQVQNFDSIAPYTIEEAYEVVDAITRRDWDGLPDELGDLLLQIVYYARMAEEAGRFDFETIARLVADKMVRRHPHVFDDASLGAAGVKAIWENNKEIERHARQEHGALAGVAIGLPALLRAMKLTSRAARVGFDWPDATRVLVKLDEEIAEFRAELEDADPARLQDEFGDILFTMASLARKLHLDPEACLRHANDKFQRRFNAMEQIVESTGKSMHETSLVEMEAGWQAVKASERS
ncbi:nucleoside triphosphate pyrophosphohydrolase [Lichenicola cladoniae]|uniref:Nucleoside triphosphate pyrophosphohydrolase n=1 Tax=Lichenicola cladoniae TaxID=1484109 RepID=A0A6M8HQ04_9PROT|nr:nucleoside triphosphate pyrophosphohydrolase [Lichenicola cladoniae]NPD69733.1 nucleoside triphosphate pyrophosphohydrolase [Acetobacteraceae bacterium]QKE90432.1 nucleoside triphosphate pyrophosphohydrolase [Lichenicola cladoniae]